MTVSSETIKKMIEWIPPKLISKVKKESWRYDQEKEKTKGANEEDVLLNLKQNAYQDGFLQGEKMGLETGREVIQDHIKKISLLEKELEQPVSFLTEDIFSFIKKAIVSTSQAIIMKEIKSDENIIDEVLKDVMTEIGSLSKEIHIKCSPEEEEFFKKFFSEMDNSKIHIESDKDVSNGGFILKTENSYVNATVEKRIEEIIATHFEKPLLKDTQNE